MREALKSWKKTYSSVKWYIEVYGLLDIEIPEYDEPVIMHKKCCQPTKDCRSIVIHSLKSRLRNPLLIKLNILELFVY